MPPPPAPAPEPGAAATPAPVCYADVDSPLGRLRLVARGQALVGLYFADRPKAPQPGPDWVADRGALADTERQLAQYFAGQRTAFTVPVALSGTAFQRRVWAVLRGIGYGEAISYAELARRAGNPRASRAVGGANGANPVTVVVPCHRVIAADGGLGGYGGGTDRKAWLLRLEGHPAGGLG